MNQSEFLAVTCILLQAWEKSHVQGAVGFAFAPRWLKNWRDNFKPISKRSKSNDVFTFDSHLKTALAMFFRAPTSFSTALLSSSGMEFI